MGFMRVAPLVVGLGVGLGACTDRSWGATQASIGTSGDTAASTDATAEPEPTSTATSEPEVDPTPSLGARVIYSEGLEEYGTRIRIVDDSGTGAVAPVTLLEWSDAPVNDPLYLSPSRRWAVLTSNDRIWVADLAGAAPAPPKEVTPGGQPGWWLALRISDDDRWLGFASGGRLYLCELAPGGGCVAESYGPPSPQAWVDDLAFGAHGQRFAYARSWFDGPPTEVILGRLGAPDEATVLGSLAANISEIRFAQDDRTVYFTASAYNGVGASGLYAADLTTEPPTAIRISEASSEDGWGCDWGLWAPDLSGFLWHARDCPGDLWWVPLVGAQTGAAVRVSSSAAGGWSISPDSGRFLFSSHHEAAGIDDLYQVQRDAPNAAPIKLSAPLGDATEIDFASFLAGSPRVVYLARGIFVADPATPGAAVRVDSSDGDLAFEPPLVSADASRLLYLEYTPEPEDASTLRYVDISGVAPGPAVDITPTLSGSSRRVIDRRFSDDGRRVYLQTRDDDGMRLFRVDLSGPTPFATTELSGAGDQVWRFEVLAPTP